MVSKKGQAGDSALDEIKGIIAHAMCAFEDGDDFSTEAADKLIAKLFGSERIEEAMCEFKKLFGEVSA